jgi:hypothetical protein
MHILIRGYKGNTLRNKSYAIDTNEFFKPYLSFSRQKCGFTTECKFLAMSLRGTGVNSFNTRQVPRKGALLSLLHVFWEE